MCNAACYTEEVNRKERISPNDIITGLIRQISFPLQQTLVQIIANQALQPPHIMEKLQKSFIYCWIERDKIINDTNFYFQFKLFFQHQSILYIYKFKTFFKNIQYLHKNAYNDTKHFATQRFPTPLESTSNRRGEELKEELCFMGEYMMIDATIEYIKRNRRYSSSGPGKEHWWSSKRRKANKDDINAGAYFLCKLFNSPSYILDNTVCFKKCNVVNGIRDILKEKAKIFLNKLRIMAKRNVYKNLNEYKILYNNDKWKKMIFHSIFVVCRPMNGLNKTSLTDHWGLKFEGDKYLLTIDWYGNSVIILKLEENTCLGQRICWYSWSKRSSQLFNARWGTLIKIYLEKDINGECIGKLINKWLQIYPEYNNMNNNCQHFVRDIVSVFQLNSAKYLSTKLDDRIVSGIIFPSLPLMDEIDERHRIEQIRNILSKIYQQYTKDVIKGDNNNNNDNDNDNDNNKYKDNNKGNEDADRFKKWLCDKLKLSHLLDLFIMNDLNDSRMIKYLDDDTLKTIGIELYTEREKILINAKLYSNK